MSENLFPPLNDGDKDTAPDELDSASFGFKMQLATSVTPNISEEFALDSIHNENGKRSLSPVNSTVSKKICAKGDETKSDFYDGIFEPDMQLQIDCDASQIEPYPQDNSYVENSTDIGTNMYYPSASFHSSEQISLKMPVSNEFQNQSLNISDSSLNQSKGPQNYDTSEINESEINAIINGLDDEINNVLEETARRNKLTATNVKNILRHVITNEYVLAMVRNTMRLNGDEEGELEDAVYEPKLTRSKVKELREKQADLPWPVPTPEQQNVQKLTKRILEEEFSDNENSSDEEYKPNEEDCHSEDEEASSLKASSIRSPNSNKDLASSPDKAFIWDLDPPLVIAEPEAVPGSNKDDLIALRTRSKLPLVDTLLETIEASFIAPDITVDMYDTECDDEDWQNFLLEFTKPLDSKLSPEHPDDDGDDDPEYNVLEDEDDGDDKQSIKISQKELNALMDIILETAEQKLIGTDEEDENNIHEEEMVVSVQPETVVQFGQMFGQRFADEASTWFSDFERLQLKEQMRMHVQLLTQSFLLSQGKKELSEMNNTSAILLEELGTFCIRDNVFQRNSYFCADNLEEALTIVNASKSEKYVLATTPKPGEKNRAIPSRAQATIAHSRVFIYPHLLPVAGFRPSMHIKPKAIFTDAEDFLLALGLEQFSSLDNPVHLIKTLLLPTKTVKQLKLRISNSRLSKCNPKNPVKYYHVYGRTPAIFRCLKPYDQASVKPPCELPINVLPKWMHTFVVHLHVPETSPVVTLQRKVGVVHPFSFRLPERRGYRRILPGAYVSPLKKVSPFLTKIIRRRKVTPKVAALQYKSLARMVPIKPKPTSITNTNPLPTHISPYFVPMGNHKVDSTSIFIPPVTTTIVSKLIFITDASQIIQNPKLSTVPPPIMMKTKIIPTICDSSSQKVKRELIKEIVINSEAKNQERIIKDVKNDCYRNCITSTPKSKRCGNSSISDASEIASVSSVSENAHDQEISLDLKVYEESDDNEVVDDTHLEFEICEEADDEAVNDTPPDLEVCEETDDESVDDTPPDLEICEEADDDKAVDDTHIGFEACEKADDEAVDDTPLDLELCEEADDEAVDDTPPDLEMYAEADDEAVDDTPPDLEICEEADDESVDDSPLDLEVCEKADNKAVDDKRDLAALITASNTICMEKKYQRDLKSTLQLLSPNVLKVNPKEPETIFARTCLLRAVEALKNEPQTYDKLLRTLCSFKSCTKSPVKLFSEVHEILKDHPILVDEFVGFLSPAQAKECGKFHQYVTISKIRAFLRRLEIYFRKQPDHLHKILRMLCQLQNQKLTPVSVIATLKPLLMKQSHLLEEFLQILPYEPPPESHKDPKKMLATDFEEAKVANNSDCENGSGDSCKKAKMPDAKNPCGGKDCPCSCHSSTVNIQIQNRKMYCTNCGIKVENAVEEKLMSIVTPTEHSLTTMAENHSPSASPYEVIEDAVLPAVVNSRLSIIPSDFSGIQETFSFPTKCQTLSSSEARKCSPRNTDESANSSRVSTVNSDSELNLPYSKSCSENSFSSSVSSSPTDKTSSSPPDWTRDQDKVILETYRKHGVSKESFIMAANAIGTKTASQVKERFVEIIRCLEKHLKAIKS